MEELSIADSRLSTNLHKCRCCFRMLINDRSAGTINQETRIQFFDLTQIELLESEYFSDRICELCSRDLKVFASIRLDLISKQRDLYDLAGLEEEQYTAVKTPEYEDAFTEESQADVDMSFEYVENEYEPANDDQMTEDHLYEEQIVDEDSQSTDVQFLKIEKVEESAVEVEDEAEQYELFEEIVIVDQKPKDENRKDHDSSYWLADEISCDLCGIELAKSHMEEHKRKLHKSFDCDECSKTFESLILFKRHVQDSHSKESSSKTKKRKHFCPLCPKDYDYKKQLIDHLRSFHERERNSQCCICLKSFYHRDLKKHMEHVHSEKTIDCEICGKKYTCVENLKLHMKYHKPPEFICSSRGCGKSFHQKILLEHHEIKQHTNEKTVPCSECKQSFFTIRDQKRHFQRVHEQVVRKCMLCDTQFNRKDKYRVHLLKKHADLSTESLDSMLEEVRKMKWNES